MAHSHAPASSAETPWAGLLCAAGVALIAAVSGMGQAAIPSAVLAVAGGIFLRPWLTRLPITNGLNLASGPGLKIAVALIGLKLSLADVVVIGAGRVALMLAVMAVTVVACRIAAGLLGLDTGAGLVMGAANAICGASAAIAMSAALPARMQDQRLLVLTIVMANGMSTLAMLAYPLLADAAGLPPEATALFLGASIQDMAQVAGAVSALPPEAAKAGITLKMARVLLLLPLVVVFTRGLGVSGGRPAIPTFAVVFVGLALANSLLTALPGLTAVYMPIRTILLTVSNALLLLALAAMGLNTSWQGLRDAGWRPYVLFGTGTGMVLIGAGVLVAVQP